MEIFGIIFFLVTTVVCLIKAGSKFPLFGLFIAGLVVWFFVETCVQYEKDWGNPEAKEREAEQRMREFNDKLHREMEENHRKWEYSHPEEAKREKEREEFRKKWAEEHGE